MKGKSFGCAKSRAHALENFKRLGINAPPKLLREDSSVRLWDNAGVISQQTSRDIVRYWTSFIAEKVLSAREPSQIFSKTRQIKQDDMALGTRARISRQDWAET